MKTLLALIFAAVVVGFSLHDGGGTKEPVIRSESWEAGYDEAMYNTFGSGCYPDKSHFVRVVGSEYSWFRQEYGTDIAYQVDANGHGPAGNYVVGNLGSSEYRAGCKWGESGGDYGG